MTLSCDIPSRDHCNFYLLQYRINSLMECVRHCQCCLVFRVVDPCGIVGRYRRFDEIFCVHLQGVTTQITNTDILPSWKSQTSYNTRRFSLNRGNECRLSLLVANVPVGHWYETIAVVCTLHTGCRLLRGPSVATHLVLASSAGMPLDVRNWIGWAELGSEYNTADAEWSIASRVTERSTIWLMIRRHQCGSCHYVATGAFCLR
jgi:hypothetical protein